MPLNVAGDSALLSEQQVESAAAAAGATGFHFFKPVSNSSTDQYALNASGVLQLTNTNTASAAAASAAQWVVGNVQANYHLNAAQKIVAVRCSHDEVVVDIKRPDVSLILRLLNGFVCSEVVLCVLVFADCVSSDVSAVPVCHTLLPLTLHRPVLLSPAQHAPSVCAQPHEYSAECDSGCTAHHTAHTSGCE